MGREWAYKNIVPKIVCERLLGKPEEASRGITDYRFFCFCGKPRFIMVDVAKYQDIKRNLYLPDWTYIDMRVVYDTLGDTLKKPERLEEMIRVAEILSEDFPHVRVDLYCIDENGKESIYFGELTFYHTGGNSAKYDKEFNRFISEGFVLPEKRFGDKR